MMYRDQWREVWRDLSKSLQQVAEGDLADVVAHVELTLDWYSDLAEELQAIAAALDSVPAAGAIPGRLRKVAGELKLESDGEGAIADDCDLLMTAQSRLLQLADEAQRIAGGADAGATWL
jgi:hypothetical protein